jgi:hypothetical protein
MGLLGASHLIWHPSLTPPGTKTEKAADQVEEQPDLPVLTKTTERRLMAKIDWHVMPCLCIMYLLAFIDRYAATQHHCRGFSGAKVVI